MRDRLPRRGSRRLLPQERGLPPRDLRRRAQRIPRGAGAGAAAPAAPVSPSPAPGAQPHGRVLRGARAGRRGAGARRWRWT